MFTRQSCTGQLEVEELDIVVVILGVVVARRLLVQGHGVHVGRNHRLGYGMDHLGLLVIVVIRHRLQGKVFHLVEVLFHLLLLDPGLVVDLDLVVNPRLMVQSCLMVDLGLVVNPCLLIDLSLALDLDLLVHLCLLAEESLLL